MYQSVKNFHTSPHYTNSYIYWKHNQQNMKISRTKFVIIFLISALAFQFITNSFFLSEVRLFPANGESFLGIGSETTWKHTLSIALLPIKIVLIGPLIPFIDFLRQEPDTPPPFFLIGFVIYWTILALAIHYLFNKIKRNGSNAKSYPSR